MRIEIIITLGFIGFVIGLILHWGVLLLVTAGIAVYVVYSLRKSGGDEAFKGLMKFIFYFILIVLSWIGWLVKFLFLGV